MRNVFTYYDEEDFLAHYGILGQKWGVRRFQNPDGTLTDAGKKRLAKDLSKQKYESTDQMLAFAQSKIDHKMIKNREELIDAAKKLREASKRHVPFDESEDFYDKVSTKAYNDTYKWFEKNKPDILKEMIEKSGGDKYELDRFHDFRKTLEGYEDAHWQKAEADYYKIPANKKARDDEDAAYKKYLRECEKASRDLIGDYGNTTINSVYRPGSSVYGNYYKNVGMLVEMAVRQFTVKQLKK